MGSFAGEYIGAISTRLFKSLDCRKTADIMLAELSGGRKDSLCKFDQTDVSKQAGVAFFV